VTWLLDFALQFLAQETIAVSFTLNIVTLVISVLSPQDVQKTLQFAEGQDLTFTEFVTKRPILVFNALVKQIHLQGKSHPHVQVQTHIVMNLPLRQQEITVLNLNAFLLTCPSLVRRGKNAIVPELETVKELAVPYQLQAQFAEQWFVTQLLASALGASRITHKMRLVALYQKTLVHSSRVNQTEIVRLKHLKGCLVNSLLLQY
jgi:hypothetical protein